jgi:hypothetical protein
MRTLPIGHPITDIDTTSPGLAGTAKTMNLEPVATSPN